MNLLSFYNITDGTCCTLWLYTGDEQVTGSTMNRNATEAKAYPMQCFVVTTTNGQKITVDRRDESNRAFIGEVNAEHPTELSREVWVDDYKNATVKEYFSETEYGDLFS